MLRCLLISSIFPRNSSLRSCFCLSSAKTKCYFSATSSLSSSSRWFFSESMRSITACSEVILAVSSICISCSNPAFSSWMSFNFEASVFFRYSCSLLMLSTTSAFSFYSYASFRFRASFRWFTSLSYLFSVYNKKVCSSSSYVSISSRSRDRSVSFLCKKLLMCSSSCWTFRTMSAFSRYTFSNFWTSLLLIYSSSTSPWLLILA